MKEAVVKPRASLIATKSVFKLSKSNHCLNVTYYLNAPRSINTLPKRGSRKDEEAFAGRRKAKVAFLKPGGLIYLIWMKFFFVALAAFLVLSVSVGALTCTVPNGIDCVTKQQVVCSGNVLEHHSCIWVVNNWGIGHCEEKIR